MADQTLARHVNARSLLTLLRQRGPLSRAEIARSLGLTQATISRLSAELIARGLVTEGAGGKGGARSPGPWAGGAPGLPAVPGGDRGPDTGPAPDTGAGGNGTGKRSHARGMQDGSIAAGSLQGIAPGRPAEGTQDGSVAPLDIKDARSRNAVVRLGTEGRGPAPGQVGSLRDGQGGGALPPGRPEAAAPGRPGIALAIAPAGAEVLGVEIGVHEIRFVRLNLALDVVAAEEIAQEVPPSPEAAARMVREGIARHRSPRLVGVGVTLPGLVTTAGHVVNLPILGWREVDFRGLLAGIDLPVILENNANAAAFGAVYAQPGQVAPFTLFLKLGTGCGGAAILDGRLMRGADGTGLEPGHLKVADQGPRCSCGQVGCLETFVNLAALSRLQGVEGPEALAAAITRGEGAALRAHLAHHLGLGIAALVTILNPAQVVLGGALLPVLRQILPEISAQVAARIIPGTRMPAILPSRLGPFECAIGAGCLIHQAEFDIAALQVGLRP